MAQPRISMEEIKEQFDERGYVVLSDFLDSVIIAKARDELEDLVDDQAHRLLTRGKISDPLSAEPFETRLARLYEHFPEEAPTLFRPELHLPGLFYLFFHPHLLDIVEGFLGAEIRLYPNYTVRPKLPDHEPSRVLWHQDGGYTKGQVEQLRMVNVWMPVIPARVENGCMQFIPGSHRLGIVPHERMKHYLEISENYLKPRLSEAVSIELDPGDVVIFHNLLFHQGLPNLSKTVRWSLDWRYQDSTQDTLRQQKGHIARSRSHPETEVSSAVEWAGLSLV